MKRELTWWETIGVLGGDLFVLIILFCVLYVAIEIVSGAREERKSNDDLQEYVEELEHNEFYNQEEDPVK